MDQFNLRCDVFFFLRHQFSLHIPIEHITCCFLLLFQAWHISPSIPLLCQLEPSPYVFRNKDVPFPSHQQISDGRAGAIHHNVSASRRTAKGEQRKEETHAVAAPADRRAAAANLKETMVVYMRALLFAGPFLPPSLQKSDGVRSQVELLSSPLPQVFGSGDVQYPGLLDDDGADLKLASVEFVPGSTAAVSFP